MGIIWHKKYYNKGFVFTRSINSHLAYLLKNFNSSRSHLKKYVFFIFIVLLFFSFRNNQKDVLNPSTTLIVLNDKPNYLEVQGAKAISKWLKKIYKTDSGFPIIKQSLLTDIKGKIIIAIGNTKFISSTSLKNLPPYSFIINKKEKRKSEMRGDKVSSGFKNKKAELRDG